MRYVEYNIVHITVHDNKIYLTADRYNLNA